MPSNSRVTVVRKLVQCVDDGQLWVGGREECQSQRNSSSDDWLTIMELGGGKRGRRGGGERGGRERGEERRRENRREEREGEEREEEEREGGEIG